MHTEIQDFTRRLVQMIVDWPEAVEITAQTEGDSVDLTIRVAPGEVAMVIGEHGDLVKSIQLLANAVAARFARRVKLHVEERNGTQIASAGRSDSPRRSVREPGRPRELGGDLSDTVHTAYAALPPSKSTLRIAKGLP